MTAAARTLTGMFIALCSAASFAMNLTLAPFVYDAGGNIHALNLVRAGAVVLTLFVVVRARGISLALPRGMRTSALMLGLFMCIEMYAILGAIVFIPVGLAVLFMYAYPLIVSVLAAVEGRDRLTPVRVAALIAAFAGLAIALDAPSGAVDARGAALGILTAVAFGLMVYFCAHAM